MHSAHVGHTISPADAATLAAQLSRILRRSEFPLDHDTQAQTHAQATSNATQASNPDGTGAVADTEPRPHSLVSLARWLERHARTSDAFLDAVARGTYAPLGLVGAREGSPVA